MKPKGLIITMAAMPILIAFTLGIAGVWLTGELIVLPLVGLAATIVGGALVVYFNWRETFLRWILNEATMSGTPRSQNPSAGLEREIPSPPPTETSPKRRL